MGLGSGIRDPEKKTIPDPGPRSKRHRIPDPDPQHWKKITNPLKNRLVIVRYRNSIGGVQLTFTRMYSTCGMGIALHKKC
jgi:hypothetical protein